MRGVGTAVLLGVAACLVIAFAVPAQAQDTAMRIKIGDDGFYAFLQDYSVQFTGRIATASDFFALLKKHTDKDISAILPKYFK